jgi:hypothetical protein
VDRGLWTVDIKLDMGKDSNIVHEYFKKKFDDFRILVKVNPILYKGTEITIFDDGRSEMRNMEFDHEILDDLKADGFESASALEFNLYLSGLDSLLAEGDQ